MTRRLLASVVAVTLAGLGTASIAYTQGAAAADFPTPSGEVTVTETTQVTGTFDGELQRFSGIGDGGQDEGQDAMFELADGGGRGQLHLQRRRPHLHAMMSGWRA